MFLKVLFTAGLFGIAICSFGQQQSQRTPRSSGNSLHPGKPEAREKKPKSSHVRGGRKQGDPVREYYERMEDVAKAYRRAERLSKKPQYSDPMYFGHKRPPKKRSAARMRYCNECGIRH